MRSKRGVSRGNPPQEGNARRNPGGSDMRMREKTRLEKIQIAVALLLCLAVAGAAVYRFCVPQRLLVQKTGYAMGTVTGVQCAARQEQQAGEAAEAALAECSRLETVLSAAREDAELACVNAGETALSEELAAFLRQSLDTAEKSGGAFNPAIGALSTLWGIGTENARLPGAEEIAAARALCDYRNITLSGLHITLPEGTRLDLGAAGKGAACDAMAEILREAGMSGFLAYAGGSIAVSGKTPDGKEWPVRVRDPFGSAAETMGTIYVSEGFVSTSGNYEKTLTAGGKTYHHILDGATGWPAETGLCSVTVVCGSGILSDELSTACFVLGREKGEELLRQYGAEGIFIESPGEVILTEGLKSSFTPTDGWAVVS